MILSNIFSRIIFGTLVPIILLSYCIIVCPNIIFLNDTRTENEIFIFSIVSLILFFPMLFNIIFCICAITFEILTIIKDFILKDVFTFINGNTIILYSWPITFWVLVQMYLLYCNLSFEKE